MLKQCMSLDMFTVVIEIFFVVKSHPEEKLQFHPSESFRLPEKFMFCVNLYGYLMFFTLMSFDLSSAMVTP